MQTLYVGAVIEKAGDALPISRAIFIDQLFKLLVLLLGPPALLECAAVLRTLVVVNLRNFFKHLVNQVFIVGGRLVLRGLVVELFKVGNGSFACVFVESFEGFRGES